MASMQLENQVREQLTANLNNQSRQKIHPERYFKWSNPHLSPQPPTIDALKEVTFDKFVSKGAVVYAGPVINERPDSSPAWVLAWDTTAHKLIPPTPNKVYVTCGPHYIIEKMSDGEILKKLNESTSPDGSYVDHITKATIHANLSHLIPSGDFLKATFAHLIG